MFYGNFTNCNSTVSKFQEDAFTLNKNALVSFMSHVLQNFFSTVAFCAVTFNYTYNNNRTFCTSEEKEKPRQLNTAIFVKWLMVSHPDLDFEEILG